MIVERNAGTTMESNMVGQKIQMRVDTSNMAHIMGILTDLYSDPELAVIREYSTNAWDAHVEAGVTRPIEVTLPSALSPFLSIRDFGIGLDVEAIERIYSQYGASTKRGTNDQNGMLGLGCKSALTYSDQFSLVARKDGKSYTVSISRDAEGNGTMQVEQVLDTDEDNGVEVVIPAKRGNTMARTAEDFYRAWKPGTVLVNGAEPEPFDGLPVSDNMLVIEGAQDYIVMGNVPYPVEEGKLSHGLAGRNRHYYRGGQFSLVAFVKIGEVNFPPPRESLHYNATTEHTIQRISAEFKANATTAIQKQMDKCATAGEAVATMVRYHAIMPSQAGAMQAAGKAYTYQGQPVPTRFDAPRVVWSSRHSRHLSQQSEDTMIPAEKWPTTLFVYGWDLAKITPDQKKKLNKYVEDNNLDVEGYALVKDKPTLPWLSMVVDYEATIKPIKLTPQHHAAVSGRIPGSYDLYDCVAKGSRNGVPANDIDQNRTVFYAGRGKYSGQSYREFVKAHYPDAYIVSMPSTRVAKFKRHFPKAMPVEQSVTDQYEGWKKNILPAHLVALACSEAGDTAYLSRLDASKIEDPKLRKAVKTAQINVTKIIDQKSTYDRFMRQGVDLKLPKWENPLDKYPLYTDTYNRRPNMPHVYAYMNCVYALRQQGKL